MYETIENSSQYKKLVDAEIFDSLRDNKTYLLFIDAMPQIGLMSFTPSTYNFTITSTEIIATVKWSGKFIGRFQNTEEIINLIERYSS